MNSTTGTSGPTARRHYRWLLVIPFLWQACLAPAVNDIAMRPFGLPFPMVWQMAGIVVTSLVIGLVFKLDRLAGVDAQDAAFLAATADSAETAGDVQ